MVHVTHHGRVVGLVWLRVRLNQLCSLEIVQNPLSLTQKTIVDKFMESHSFEQINDV